MKYLIILGLFLFVGAYIFWRIRPYLSMARRVLGMLRDVRRINLDGNPSDILRQQRTSTQQTPRQKSSAANERLVRCATCGTWTPAARAVTLRTSNTFYCSHDCLERAADAPRRTHKSAS
ncbi:MAG TPA: hypothetical protein VF666_05350 [Pyrinomonadaceae bacterium]